MADKAQLYNMYKTTDKEQFVARAKMIFAVKMAEADAECCMRTTYCMATGNINKNMVDFKSRTDFLFLETPNIASDSSEMSGTWNASSEPVLEGRVLEGIHMRDEIDGEDEDEDDEEDDDCGRMVVSDDDVDH